MLRNSQITDKTSIVDVRSENQTINAVGEGLTNYSPVIKITYMASPMNPEK